MWTCIYWEFIMREKVVKKIFFLALIIIVILLVSCEKEKKLFNSKLEKGEQIIYLSALGNKYYYRQAKMINKGYAYQSNFYISSNNENIDILLIELPIKGYKEKMLEEFQEELFSKDIRDVFVFELNYGNEKDEFLETMTYYISPTKIMVSCKSGERQSFYILMIDEEFYSNFYQLECNLMTKKD